MIISNSCCSLQERDNGLSDGKGLPPRVSSFFQTTEMPAREVHTFECYRYFRVLRHKAIFKAGESLTSKRGQSCCVERNYVRRLYDYFTLSEDVSQSQITIFRN